MIRIQVYPSGFTLTHSVPESVEEYNALAPKRTNPVLEDAINNVEYRGVFPKFRDKLCDLVEKETGIKMKMKTVGTGDKTKQVPDETDGKYLARVQAELGLEDADFVARFQEGAQAIIDTIKLDPSVREGSGDGPKVGKNDLKLATELLTQPAEKVNEVLGKLSALLNLETVLSLSVAVEGADEATVAGVKEENTKTIARAFGDWRRKQAAEAAAKTKAALGM